MQQQTASQGSMFLSTPMILIPYRSEYRESGSIAVAAGGHYVEGAWSVVMAYDYLMGRRYTPEDAVKYTPLLIVRKAISLVRQALVQLQNNPETLDKANFSRFHWSATRS
ncbi:MAG: hypothetical protein H7A01_10905 [Hahellaceae bacterium]|nr:hypothetical protein [Hahellaceae bacterium]